MDAIGGRLPRCRPGDPEYDEDPYRGQRRRPWMMFSLGFKNTIMMEMFEVMVVNEMLTEGILLDRMPLCFTNLPQTRRLLVDKISDGLEKCKESYSIGPLSKPIVIVVSNAFGFMKNLFHGEIHIVKFSVRQCKDVADGYCDFLKHQCSTLSNYLRTNEQLEEGIAYAIPIGKCWSAPRNARGTATYDSISFCQRFVPENFRRERCIAMYTENKLIFEIIYDKMLRRLEDPFQYIYQNLDLLTVLNYIVATKNPECVHLRNHMIHEILRNYIPRLKCAFLPYTRDVDWHYHSITLFLEIFKFFSIVVKFRPQLISDYERACVARYVSIYRANYQHTPWRSQTSQNTDDKIQTIIRSIEQVL